MSGHRETEARRVGRDRNEPGAGLAADAALERAVATAIHRGATWAEIADGLGVTRQSAHERYRQLRYDPATGAAWHEPPSRSDIPAPPSPFTYHDPTVHPSLDLAVVSR